MPKINSELFELFSNPKTFDTTIELIDSFEEFRIEIFNTFWQKLVIALNEAEDLSQWKVLSDLIDIKNSYINICKNESDNICFQIYYKNKNTSNGGFNYGITTSIELNERLEKIYRDVKKFKKDGWRMGNLNYREMPIWYKLDSIDFINNENLRKFLPEYVDTTVKETVDDILYDFNQEVQEFIIENIKPEPPEIYTLEENH